MRKKLLLALGGIALLTVGFYIGANTPQNQSEEIPKNASSSGSVEDSRDKIKEKEQSAFGLFGTKKPIAEKRLSIPEASTTVSYFCFENCKQEVVREDNPLLLSYSFPADPERFSLSVDVLTPSGVAAANQKIRDDIASGREVGDARPREIPFEKMAQALKSPSTKAIINGVSYERHQLGGESAICSGNPLGRGYFDDADVCYVPTQTAAWLRFRSGVKIAEINPSGDPEVTSESFLHPLFLYISQINFN